MNAKTCLKVLIIRQVKNRPMISLGEMREKEGDKSKHNVQVFVA